MVKFLLSYWNWILGSITVLCIIVYIFKKILINGQYPDLKEELKNTRYRFLNISLTPQYIVVGTIYQKVIPYSEVTTCEEIVVDMFSREAGKAIALKMRDGKIVKIANIKKELNRDQFSCFKSKIVQAIS